MSEATSPYLKQPLRTEAEARGTRYCESCRWCELPSAQSSYRNDPEFMRCTHPKNTRKTPGGLRLVSRAVPPTKPVLIYCLTQRERNEHDGHELCGPEGRWFEPMPEPEPENARELAEKHGTHEIDEENAAQDAADRARE